MTDPSWHALEHDVVFERTNTERGGLSTDEADRRLSEFGRNELNTAEVVSPLRILLHQFTSPLIYILLVAFAVTVLIDHRTDAIVIAAVLVINAIIGFIQEYRAENAMAALASLVSPKARVRRNGSVTEVDSTELVPGDIVLLESGDIVPADIRLIETRDLTVDAAILTGESVASSRHPDPTDAELTVGDRRNMAHMGTTVATGRGVGVVVATGASTQIGAIAGEMRQTERAPTPLQIRMRRFGHLVSVVILAAGAAVILIGLSQAIPLGDIFLLAVAIAVSAIPEGLPVVMTVALAISVRRMAGRNAIIRRLPAVETLGSCSVILSDKTGTMTENRMTVQRVWTADGSYEVTGSGRSATGSFTRDGDPVDVHATPVLVDALQAGAFANEATIRDTPDGTLEMLGDATETALLVVALKAGFDREGLLNTAPEIDHHPFESDRRYSASVHAHDSGPVTYVKGAPERVVDLCSSVRTESGSTPIDRDALLTTAESLAGAGLRVLAVATATGNRLEAGTPSALEFLGFVGMLDPPRAGVDEAIERCERAGIRVLMVTGDHAATAQAIAERVGIESDEVLTGAELAELDDAELDERLRTTSVFARISPMQKHRLVTRLQAAGEIVAVTGDGVNDAPALKAAHIGAAMGITGTDVAKEASEMVLTDDNFATIYAAVEEGRTVFANIRKATSFLLATGVGLVLAIIAAFVLAIAGLIPMEEAAIFPLLLLPAQALWLNVVNNGIQDVALAFEPGEPEQVNRPPYDPEGGLLSTVLLERTVIVGSWLALLALVVFTVELRSGATLPYSQTAALSTMVVSMAMFLGTCRSETRPIWRKDPRSNPLLLVGTLAAITIHLLAIHWGPTQLLLGVEPISLDTWLRIIIIAPSVILLSEAHKWLRRDRVDQTASPESG